MTNRTQSDVIPPGFKTDIQWAKEAKMSRAQTYKILREGMELGLIECTELRIPTGHGVRSVRHYRKIAKRSKKP